MEDNSGAFFASYYISKQITELIIDMVVFTHRNCAPGITRAWVGNVLPVVKRILRRF